MLQHVQPIKYFTKFVEHPMANFDSGELVFLWRYMVLLQGSAQRQSDLSKIKIEISRTALTLFRKVGLFACKSKALSTQLQQTSSHAIKMPPTKRAD